MLRLYPAGSYSNSNYDLRLTSTHSFTGKDLLALAFAPAQLGLQPLGSWTRPGLKPSKVAFEEGLCPTALALTASSTQFPVGKSFTATFGCQSSSG